MYPCMQNQNIIFFNIFNSYVTLLLVITLLISTVFTVPHVFEENYDYCEIDFGIPDGKKIVFSNKLWTVATGDLTLYFSFCKSIQSSCKNQTSSCLIRKKDNQMIDLGHKFQLVDVDNYILESVEGAKCPYSNGYYTLTVNLECSDTVKPIPRLTAPEESSCNFEVSMLRPGCQPKCTNVLGNAYMIDLRRFPKNIDVDSDLQKFSFSVCGFSRKCASREIGACEIMNDTIIPLAVTESQVIDYDMSENKLIAKGRYKEGRVIRELNILIKCNWESENFNVKYKKPYPKQGRKYQFVMESSYGCIKLPQNCFVLSTDNSQYNLSKIYNPNGWKVANVPEGDIILNICGSLKNPSNTVCSNQYSQVCQKQDSTYINRGSILQPLSVIDDVITAKILSGSRCKENVDLLYNTVIEFACSNIEKGPVFKEFRECTTFIQWETPHACPIYFYRGNNCLIHDKYGYRNLKNLFSETDKLHQLLPSHQMELVYNLCGPLHVNCNNFSNVSFCLKTGQNKEVIIGWDNKDLISENGILRLELTGDKCLNNKHYGKVTINFICNYKEPSPPSVIRVDQDGCVFNMSVYTPLACLSENNFHDCIYNFGNTSYDLSPLIQKDRNYVIKEKNVEYILNVCGPIITGPGALCSNTMLCLNNKTEISPKYRYISLGSIAGPTLINGNLILEASMGTYCEGYGFYKSIIHFQCSQKKYAPTLLSTSPCIYNFIWKTPEACPITRNCVINDSKLESSLDLTNLEEKTLKVNLQDNAVQYEFHLCKDAYKRYKTGKQNIFRLERKFYYENYKSFLKLELPSSSGCRNNSEIGSVILEFRCNRNSHSTFKEQAFENCTLKMIVYTSLVCSDEKDNFEYALEHSTHPSSTSVDLEFIQNTDHSKDNKCSIISQDTGYELKVLQLPSGEIGNGTNKYSLNFDGKLSCNGILCKNNIKLLPMNACPVSLFDRESNYMKLHYLTELPCGQNENFQFVVLLNCMKTKKTDLKIVKNTSCELVVEHYSSASCFLFHEKSVPSKTALIGGVVGTVLAVVLIGFIIYLIKIRRFPYIHIQCTSDKSSVPIYRRNCRE